MTKTYRGWIIAPTGCETRFKIALESSLFPNTFDSPRKSWADRRGAMRALTGNGYGKFAVVDSQPFDLVQTSPEVVADYHRRGQMRRDAIITWSDSELARKMRRDDFEESEFALTAQTA